MKEIASAFIKAQKQFKKAIKSKVNTHFNNRYADLPACIEAVVDALNNNGIAIIQQTHPSENNVIVETLLLHESGENITGGKLQIPIVKHHAQGYGSALSYARRYSLMSVCCIAGADEDDDGVMASSPPEPKKADGDRDKQILEYALESCTTLDELKNCYSKMTITERQMVNSKKDEMKNKL